MLHSRLIANEVLRFKEGKMHRCFPPAGLACLLPLLLVTTSFAQTAPTGQGTPNQLRANQELTPAQMSEMAIQYQPQIPEGFPLDAQHQAYIEQVLDYWQQSSVKIKRSSADFRSWDYDPEMVNFRDPGNNKLAAFRIQDGRIRFAAPDKGQYEVNRVWVFEAKEDENGNLQPNYEPIETNSVHEKWICDGTGIYEYDFENKKLYETKIPPELQGQNIIDSPLPFFLFGADKARMLERYWLRSVTPQGAEGEVWLEAWPKRAEDAGNYKKLEIILSMDDFLPRSLHLYSPSYDRVRNPQSRAFAFENRKVNDQLSGFQDFFRQFVRPNKPLGWEWVERKTTQTATTGLPPSIK